MAEIFDTNLRALRRDRAFRNGPVLFLHERAFEDVLERVSLVQRQFRSALLIGVPDAGWPHRLRAIAADVAAVDPGGAFAQEASGRQIFEEAIDFEPGTFDLIVAMGTLDTVNDLAGTLIRLRFLLRPDSLLIGVVPGGDTLPRLRQAMRAADAAGGTAAPHVHPRIEPAALAQLLTSAGLAMPVVDVDRVNVRYRAFDRLIADLRGMAATNVLRAGPRTPLTRGALAAAKRDFESGGEEAAVETFELLHFAAWTPPGKG